VGNDLPGEQYAQFNTEASNSNSAMYTGHTLKGISTFGVSVLSVTDSFALKSRMKYKDHVSISLYISSLGRVLMHCSAEQK